ncbi:MAG: hypothetical protein MUE31_04960 [Candidatus Nanopelagicales bacterium]|jgi:hypothetical protein|nr:hypothetical protein [Candidatus Nanopelagicales bacterium]MCU0294861.1 hypothetical protein [Candidatus Nanopelagicales bacterium]
MKTPLNRKATVAASLTALTGVGLVGAVQPSQAAAPSAAVDRAQTAVPLTSRTPVKSPLVVYRSGRVAASAVISAAPKLTPMKKKVKKKHRSRRS